MTGNEIRETFVKFFESHGHRHVRSSSLVPHGDPTLLFTNAGMNQFKNVFLGLEQRPYRRAVTAQKCVRAGGKHNDLENVGFTNRHHTFFEMLGNFSFGDYFKKEAIAFAWELVTSPKWFGIPKEKIFATVFKGEEGIPRDTEAYEHWAAQGVPKDRIYEFGTKDNFWAMGDTGPCGPCSEIHYDMGPAASDQGHTDCAFGCECGRYVEIWNLVFMQFNRDAGAMTPLPKPCVDTGMGLERIAATILNIHNPNKFSNYDTDLFTPLIRRAEELTSAKYGAAAKSDASLRIIADHSRAATFLISDGVLPSNEGRGYVLRKILRRAIRHGRLLGRATPFLIEMVPAVRNLMHVAYPELVETSDHVAEVVLAEEERFSRTVEIGLKRLDEMVKSVRFTKETASQYAEYLKDVEQHPEKFDMKVVDGDVLFRWPEGPPPPGPLLLSGQDAFRLYDTYGLPRDHIEDVTRDEGVKVDWGGFDSAMEEQRARSKASWKGGPKEAANPAYAKLAETYRTEPDFYYGTAAKDCRIEAIVTKDGLVSELKSGGDGEVVLDRTVIYAESGGQVADQGIFFDNSGSPQVALVVDAYYPVAGIIAHRIVPREILRVGDRVAVVANAARREHIKRNHTATHLMHAALRGILGTHVKQSGSLVAPDHLRFDFTHFRGVDPAELREIEQQVNEHILKNHELATDVLGIDEALASGALAFFGDRYPESNVRVVTIPDPAMRDGFYSKELCGGTHVQRTGEIGFFKFVREQSVASGVRRVEAVTGQGAFLLFRKYEAVTEGFRKRIRVEEETEERLRQFGPDLISDFEKYITEAQKQRDAEKRKTALSKVEELISQARTIGDVRVLSAQVSDADRDTLRQLVDTLRQKLGSGVVVLGTADDGKVALISGVTKDLTARLHAGKIVQAVAKQVGGSGGGRPDLAEAGGKDTALLDKALGEVYDIVQRMLLSS